MSGTKSRYIVGALLFLAHLFSLPAISLTLILHASPRPPKKYPDWTPTKKEEEKKTRSEKGRKKGKPIFVAGEGGRKKSPGMDLDKTEHPNEANLLIGSLLARGISEAKKNVSTLAISSFFLFFSWPGPTSLSSSTLSCSSSVQPVFPLLSLFPFGREMEEKERRGKRKRRI